MNKINRKKSKHVIHVSIHSPLSSKPNIRKNHLQTASSSSLIARPQSNIIPQNEYNLYNQQHFIHSRIPSNTKSMSSNNEHNSSCHNILNEQSIISISNIKPNKKNINRINPFFESSYIIRKQKDSSLTNTNLKKKQKRKYCGLSLCSLMLLIYGLLALLIIIAAITIGILTTSINKSSSTSTLIVINTTTSVTTTSSTSTTSTTVSTTTSTTTTTTSTTTSTTTTFYICSNYTVKANWDYSGNDVINNGPHTFASCCAWCLTLTFCVAFTFNPWNSCLIKNSTGSGGVAYPNSIGAAR